MACQTYSLRETAGGGGVYNYVWLTGTGRTGIEKGDAATEAKNERYGSLLVVNIQMGRGRVCLHYVSRG